MTRNNISKAEIERIDDIVEVYTTNIQKFERFAHSVYSLLLGDTQLKEFAHSLKYRAKDPAHLKDKLTRKLLKAKEDEQKYNITKDNLFKKITDLAGVRFIHLHTKQMSKIDPLIKRCFEHESYELVEGPIANTWDNELTRYFQSIKIDVNNNRDTLYTSVHYVIKSTTKTEERCELQVRTLSEELWGETDHKINYPNHANSVCCDEQLRTLARLASSCTRLVDSIFASHEHHAEKIGKKQRRA